MNAVQYKISSLHCKRTFFNVLVTSWLPLEYHNSFYDNFFFRIKMPQTS